MFINRPFDGFSVVSTGLSDNSWSNSWGKLLCNFIEITFWHGCSPVNLLHICRSPFYKNSSGGLPLHIFKSQVLLAKQNGEENLEKKSNQWGALRNSVLNGIKIRIKFVDFHTAFCFQSIGGTTDLLCL